MNKFDLEKWLIEFSVLIIEIVNEMLRNPALLDAKSLYPDKDTELTNAE